MTSAADEPATPNDYELTCTDCAFATTVEGSFFDALDVADAHREENGEISKAHFVNVTRAGASD